MALLPDINIGTIVTAALVFIVTYYLFNYGFYWGHKRVPGPIPLPFIGNYFPRWMATMSLVDYDHRYYSDYGGKRYCGFFEFGQKTIMIGDLEILNHILIKDFHNFANRSKVTIADPVVDKTVLHLHDEMWKKVRSIVTPAFSSGKLKAMIPLMTHTSDIFLQQLFKTKAEEEAEHELCGLFRKYWMDIVATTAFGIEVNELAHQNGQFTTNARKIFVSLPRWRRFIYCFMNIFPFLAKITNFKLKDESATLFFKKITEEILRHRDKNGIQRNDFLQMLKEAQLKEKKDKQNDENLVLSDDIFLAQCIAFFAAGIDTVSTTLALLLHSLAFHQEIQDKVLEEIDSTFEKTKGEITYEALSEMIYLDMVLKETERMYPSVPRTYRVCKDQYTLPGTTVTLDPGTIIVIPIRCIHYDHEHYRDPKSFNPERFSSENKSKRNPISFLTFGQGPRNCIGMRFAQIKMKVCIVNLLRLVRVFPCPKSQNPIQEDKLSGVLKVSGGVWLKIMRRN